MFYEINKQEECRKLGFDWQSLRKETASSSDEGDDYHDEDLQQQQQQSPRLPLVLPGCAYYLKLTAIGNIIDCGSHDVAVLPNVSNQLTFGIDIFHKKSRGVVDYYKCTFDIAG